MKNIIYFRKLHVKIVENASAIKRTAVRWSFIGILASSLIGFIFVISEVGFDTDFIFTDWYNHKIEWIIIFDVDVCYSSANGFSSGKAKHN